MPAQAYLAGNAETFQPRDGRCFEWVTAAIEALHRPFGTLGR